MRNTSPKPAKTDIKISYELTGRQAHRFLLRWQGLVGARRFTGAPGVLAYVRQAGCIQFDPVDVCGKNAELVLFARVAGFKKETLARLLYSKRQLIDQWDKNMAICPVEDWPNFARSRQYFRGWYYSEESRRQVLEAAGPALNFVEKHGVACSRDLDMDEVVDWPWAPTNLSRAVLEYLYFAGELAIHHKQGTHRHYTPTAWALPGALLDAPEPHPGDAEYHAWHTHRRIAAVGLLWNRPSDAFLAVPGYNAAARAAAYHTLYKEGRILACRVAGLAEPLYCPAEAVPMLEEALAGRRAAPRLEFIPPLDALMWDRKLVAALFGFDYTWEIYTPQNKRKYGYYVLPVLHGDGFAGRVDLRADRKTPPWRRCAFGRRPATGTPRPSAKSWPGAWQTSPPSTAARRWPCGPASGRGRARPRTGRNTGTSPRGAWLPAAFACGPRQI